MPNLPAAPTQATPDVQTFDDACRAIRDLESEARQSHRKIHAAKKNLIKVRYRQGRMADAATNLPGAEKYGQGIMREAANRANVHERTLYDARNWFRYLQQQGLRTERDVGQFLEEEEERKRGPLTWTHCRQLASGPGENETEGETQERELQALLKRADDLEEKAFEIDEAAHRLAEEYGETEAVQEARGVAAIAREKGKDLRRQAQQADPVQKRIADEDYLQHLRESGCCICGEPGPDPHHIQTRGTGIKAHDFLAIPLCRKHHREFHDKGASYFHKVMNCDPERYALRCFAEYAYGLSPGTLS